jgi:hypothetical protein
MNLIFKNVTLQIMLKNPRMMPDYKLVVIFLMPVKVLSLLERRLGFATKPGS